MPSHEPTDIAAEFLIGGSYVDTYAGEDLTARVRGGDSARISRGLADHQSAISPATCNFTLNNRDGLFTDGNPLSPLYGKLGLSARCRIGVKDAAGTWGEYLRMPDWGGSQTVTGQNAATGDKVSLDITGDIDVRFDYTPYHTRPEAPMILMGKYIVTGNQRSWHLTYRVDGTVSLATTPDGTFGAVVAANSGVVLSEEHSVRRAVRVTLDVNNGAGGKTWRFYSADTIAGPWAEISSVTTAGTTSIFSSSAELEIGTINDGGGGVVAHTPFRGKIHAAEVYSGIAGTLVADFKPAGQGIEARTWADTCASPNTWTLAGDQIRLASDRIRASVELNSLPEDWDVTGNDRWVPVTGQGIVGRYSSNKAPLRGAIYRNYRNYAGLTGYWPMEDASGATSAAAAVPDARPGNVTQCTFGSASGLDGSTGAVTMNSAPNASKIILVTKTLPNTGYTSAVFYFRLASLPGSAATFATVYTTGGGTANRWTIGISNTSFIFTGFDQHGTTIATATTAFGATPLDQWLGMALTTKQEGGNVRWETAWHAVGSDTFYTHSSGGSTYAGTMRQFQKVEFGTPDAAFQGAQIAHVITASFEFELNTARFRDASKAYAGETFLRRAMRLAEEESFHLDWLGDPDETAACGPQPADTLFNILAAGAKVDGGILGDARDVIGFRYVTHRFLSNRRGLALDYSASHLAATPRPVGDHRFTVNDFTASRPSGSAARYEATDDRRKNVRDPDDPDSPGVGRYERGDSYGVADDDQLPGQAQRRVSLGTWDERHIPTLAVDLHRTEIFSDAVLLDACIQQDVGDPALLTGLADAPMPPDDVEMLALGYTETFSNKLWGLVFNTTPAGPFRAPALGGQGGGEPRLDSIVTEVHTSQGGVTGGATSIRVRTPRKTADNLTEPCWIDDTSYSAEFPVDIKIAGERMTLTACTVADGNAELVAGHFEDAGFTAFWLAAGGTVAQSNTFAQAGTYSARLTVAGSPTQAYIYPDLATAAPRVNPGDSITASGWVRVAVNQTDVRMTLDWLDSNGGYLGTSDSGAAGLTAAAGWVQRTVTATAPAGAHYVHYHPTILSSPSNGTFLYMDNLAITNNTWRYQTMTVTRGVNLGGAGKALADGDKPYLFGQAHFGFN